MGIRRVGERVCLFCLLAAFSLVSCPVQSRTLYASVNNIFYSEESVKDASNE